MVGSITPPRRTRISQNRSSRVRRMADRPAPVTDLAWSPEQARELGAGVLDLWTELLERLPDELVTRERAPLDTAAALALPVPEEPMPTEDVLAYLREL